MEFEFRTAGSKDLDALDRLMKKVYAAIPDKDIFLPDSRQSIEKHLFDEGRILMACPLSHGIGQPAESVLTAAFLIVRFPKGAPDNLGSSKGFDREECDRVVHMESMAADPDYRGFHLQQRLMIQGEALARAAGFVHSMCTVSPDNPWSLNNVLALGYEIVETKPKYGGKLRHILYKKL